MSLSEQKQYGLSDMTKRLLKNNLIDSINFMFYKAGFEVHNVKVPRNSVSFNGRLLNNDILDLLGNLNDYYNCLILVEGR